MKQGRQINKELYFYITPDNTGLRRKDQKRRSVVAGMIIGNELRVGKSTCSLKDQFTKVKGRGIAKSRALSENPARVQTLKGDEHVGRLFMELAKGL